MYRRFPKLKGIAGGMGAGVDKFVVVNVDDIAASRSASSKLDAGSDVTIESLKSAGVIKATGAHRNLPLKVLGNGDLGAGVDGARRGVFGIRQGEDRGGGRQGGARGEAPEVDARGGQGGRGGQGVRRRTQASRAVGAWTFF